jgi:hypothetical protein
MARKTNRRIRKVSRKNRSRRYRKQRGGEGGATGHVGKMYGDLNQQMNNSNANNLIQPLSQTGGMPMLRPADLENSGPLSTGQKGGNMVNLLERAIVPAGLYGMKQMYGKRVRSQRRR